MMSMIFHYVTTTIICLGFLIQVQDMRSREIGLIINSKEKIDKDELQRRVRKVNGYEGEFFKRLGSTNAYKFTCDLKLDEKVRKVEGNLTFYHKKLDKSKVILDIIFPNKKPGTLTQYYNGEEIWSEVKFSGQRKMERISDSSSFKFPFHDFHNSEDNEYTEGLADSIDEVIKHDEETIKYRTKKKLNGTYYQVIVDAKSYLAKQSQLINSDGKVIKELNIHSYLNYGDIYFPSHIVDISEEGKKEMRNLIFEYNLVIDDSEFDIPSN